MASMYWNAADYAKNSQGQFAWALERIEHLRLARDAIVLDVGCGDGKVSAELARRVAEGRVFGIDSSVAMIDLATRTWSSALPNIEFQVADAQALNLRPEFDIAFSNSVLHWVPDHFAVLLGVAAALKPGGHLVFTMGGRGTAAVVYHAIAALTRMERWALYLADAQSPHYFYGPDEYGDWLTRAGFAPEHISLIEKPMSLASAAALEGWLRTTWAWCTGRIPEAERPDFLREFAEQVLRGCRTDHEGNIELPMISLEVDALKVAS
jgi:trans-aconitate 2-methyltransferase